MRSARLALLVLLLSLTGCASAPGGSLRVLVYNIHAGKDVARVDNLERVAALIDSTRADLVLLQEVDRDTARSGNVDQLATLERLTKMHGAFGRAIDFQGGQYGIAILSRWPIDAVQTVPLHPDPPQAGAGRSVEPRVAMFADIAIPDGVVTVVNTHLDHSADDSWRRQEMARLLAAVGERPRRPLLVGGDFNATPDSTVIATLSEAGFADTWALCGGGDGLTYPAGVPVRRIDYLFVAGATRCTSARVIDTTVSDHRPVLVEVAR